MHLLSTTTVTGDLSPLVAASVEGALVEIDPGNVTARDIPFLIAPASALGLTGPAAEHYERTRIAVIVWRITEDFVRTHEPLVSTPDRSLTEVAEGFVARHGEEAMGCTDDLGRIIMVALNAHHLEDDFTRMLHGTQADAFDLGLS